MKDDMIDKVEKVGIHFGTTKFLLTHEEDYIKRLLEQVASGDDVYVNDQLLTIPKKIS